MTKNRVEWESWEKQWLEIHLSQREARRKLLGDIEEERDSIVVGEEVVEQLIDEQILPDT